MSTRSKTASALTSLGIIALGWHQFVGTPASSAASSPTVTVTATQAPATSSAGTGDQATSSAGTATATTDPTTATSAAASSAYRDGTYTGATQTYRYGTLSVTVTVSGGKITQVSENVVGEGSGRTEEINSYAVPELRQEVLSAQSGSISMVSGATFTSSAYQASLQSALDQA